jgi:hypothetical protein
MLFVVALAACGRLRFDPVAAGDAGGDAGVDPRIVAWYTFEDGLANGSTADVTGHGHDASCAAGLACPVVSQGHLGLAIADCMPSAPGLEALDTPELRLAAPFTLAAWARWNNNTGLSSIIAKPVGATTGNSYQLDIDQNGILRFTIGDASNFARQPVTTPLLFDQWLHIAATYDGSTMHLYVDGVELAAPMAGAAMGYDAQPLVLGSDRNGGTSAENFNRAIDDVRIYGAALSAQEIAVLASM